jgi:FdhD protein
MSEREPLGMATPFEVMRVKAGIPEQGTATVATEVPLTIMAGETEIATLACSPGNLREFVYGFLFTSGFIQTTGDVLSFTLDETRWVAYVTLKQVPDPALLVKRLFTSGCGRGVMFSNVVELAGRCPLENSSILAGSAIPVLMRWLANASPLHKESGGVHTAALSIRGGIPEIFFDDVGRHNAVDKVTGAGLLSGAGFASSALLLSGRISSEILFKARRSGIPIIISLGSVTHQTVLLARSMGLTVAGFARGESFTVYANEQRITVL